MQPPRRPPSKWVNRWEAGRTTRAETRCGCFLPDLTGLARCPSAADLPGLNIMLPADGNKAIGLAAIGKVPATLPVASAQTEQSPGGGGIADLLALAPCQHRASPSLKRVSAGAGSSG